MHAQTVELFGHVDALGQQDDLLLDAGRIQFQLGFGQAVDELLALPVEDLRHEGAHLGDLALDAIQTLLDDALELVAFALTALDEQGQHLVETGQQAGVQLVHVLLGGGHDARPAQHVQRVELALTRAVDDPQSAVDQLFSQRFVDLQLTGVGLAFEAQIAFDLAAFELLAEAFTQDRLQATQLLGQTQVGFQIALIDGANFPHRRAPVPFEFLAGVTSHAVNHTDLFGR